MKLPFKIVLINVGIAIIFSLLFSLGSLRSSPGEFLVIWFGLIGLFGGGVDIIAGLFYY
ncbi:MAG: hypothetical protein IPJ81_12350 [Chitinophagaceae bacterium]|nr:hypothetical protein [Chitinophagaceae bacterium]